MITNEQAMKIAEDSFNEGWKGAEEEISKIVDSFLQWYLDETGTDLSGPFRQFAATYKHPNS